MSAKSQLAIHRRAISLKVAFGVTAFTGLLVLTFAANQAHERVTGSQLMGPWFFAVVLVPAAIVWPMTLRFPTAGPASSILPASPLTYMCAGEYEKADFPSSWGESDSDPYLSLLVLAGPLAICLIHGVAAAVTSFILDETQANIEREANSLATARSCPEHRCEYYDWTPQS